MANLWIYFVATTTSNHPAEANYAQVPNLEGFFQAMIQELKIAFAPVDMQQFWYHS